MLFLDTNFMISEIVRKEGTIEIHFENGREFYFRVKPDKVIFYREDSDTETPFTNDIFIKTCDRAGYIMNSQISNNIDISLLTDDMIDAKYYMIPLTKNDSAVRSIKNKNRLKEYGSILSKNNLIMCPENFEITLYGGNDNNSDHIEILAQKLMSNMCMDISLFKSPLPSYVQIKYEVENNKVTYKDFIINRLPVPNISYKPLVYIGSYNIIADKTSFYTEKLVEYSEKGIDLNEAANMITEELDMKEDTLTKIEEDFDMKPEEQKKDEKKKPVIQIPQLVNKWVNWTKNVMIYVDDPKQVKLYECGNWAAIIFDFESPAQVLCNTIKSDIKVAESYALSMVDINRIAMCYDFSNQMYRFILRNTMGFKVDYNQLPYIPYQDIVDEEPVDEIYITFADHCIIIDKDPYLDSNNDILPYVNARSYISQ